MTAMSRGECLCGASSYEFDGDVKFAFRCYCQDCQRVSGGGHMPQMGISSETFSASGPIKSYNKASDAGSDLQFSFCGDCGAPLFKSTSKMPEVRFIYPGSLVAAPDVSFERKVFETSKQDWDAS